ncbi:hypothetical protein [Wenyingzhuangia sp. 2_MG-2023]|uniref:hypothetical protein n=1 Tax=Wenyingzhuangia sp. 2_MG-2023 TaxID=3062639 RepID=UPI0026E2A878|nr:hypothetical protein [Wenyingzhuangia sp. 2_MG-2023]MDO6737122.1 hypothetical protein [Wenyingzhuangia sp. 2_MG-2023]
MSKSKFDTIHEMHQDDVKNDTRFVAVSPYFVDSKNVEQGALVTMGIDGSTHLEMVRQKRFPLLIMVDKEEYEKRINT